VRRQTIGIIGASSASTSSLEMAREVGERIADAGIILVCGGLGGVMQAAAQGCCEAGGDVLGLLPGPSANEANRFVTIAVPTNMGHARNMIIAHTADVLIAVDGEYGTLSEAAIALKLGKRVLTLGSGLSLHGSEPMSSPQFAVESALSTLILLSKEEP
jgi:uncharacterized protein (TIGR00725 family)